MLTMATIPPEKLEKRKKAAEEILESERSYVDDIRVFVNVFVNGMREKLNEKDISTLFSNIEELLSFNESLLKDLEDEFKKCEGTAKDPMIGAIFIKAAPFLLMFSTFVNNHETATDRYKDLMYPSSLLGGSSDEPSGPIFEHLCRLEEKDECKGRDLLSFLIMPIQRIPRYRMLLDALIKYTPVDHPDKKDLDLALVKIEEVANVINESLRNYENRAKVLFIHEQFSSAPEIIAPHRLFVKEDDLKKMCRKGPKQYRFVLFNDCIIYGTPTAINEQVYKLSRLIEIRRVSVSSVSEDSFQLSSPAKSFHVICPSPEVKEEWIEAIQKQIDNQAQVETTRIQSMSISVPQTASPVVNGSKSEAYPSPISPKNRLSRWLTPLVTKEEDTVSLNDSPAPEDAFAPAPVWVPDKQAPNCMVCNDKFTVFIRRHHCRHCGKVVCDKCSPHRWHLPNINQKKPQRICQLCYEAIIARFESGDQTRPASPSNATAPASFSSSTSAATSSTANGAKQQASAATSSSATSAASQAKADAARGSKLVGKSDTKGASEAPAADKQAFPRPAAPQDEPDEAMLALSMYATSELPPNWFKFKDEKDRIYYWNKVTNKVQWERPTGRVGVKYISASGATSPTNPQRADPNKPNTPATAATSAATSTASTPASPTPKPIGQSSLAQHQQQQQQASSPQKLYSQQALKPVQQNQNQQQLQQQNKTNLAKPGVKAASAAAAAKEADSDSDSDHAPEPPAKTNSKFNLQSSADDASPGASASAISSPFEKLKKMVFGVLSKGPSPSPIAAPRKSIAKSAQSQPTTNTPLSTEAPPAKPAKPERLVQSVINQSEAPGARTSARDLVAQFEARAASSSISSPPKTYYAKSPAPVSKSAPTSPTGADASKSKWTADSQAKGSPITTATKAPVNAAINRVQSSASSSSLPIATTGSASASASASASTSSATGTRALPSNSEVTSGEPTKSLAERMEAYKKAAQTSTSAPRSRRSFERRRAGNLADLLNQDGFQKKPPSPIQIEKKAL